MCVGEWRGRDLEWDVKGQHKRARGYRERGGSTTLATKGGDAVKWRPLGGTATHWEGGPGDGWTVR